MSERTERFFSMFRGAKKKSGLLTKLRRALLGLTLNDIIEMLDQLISLTERELEGLQGLKEALTSILRRINGHIISLRQEYSELMKHAYTIDSPSLLLILRARVSEIKSDMAFYDLEKLHVEIHLAEVKRRIYLVSYALNRLRQLKRDLKEGRVKTVLRALTLLAPILKPLFAPSLEKMIFIPVITA